MTSWNRAGIVLPSAQQWLGRWQVCRTRRVYALRGSEEQLLPKVDASLCRKFEPVAFTSAVREFAL
jgi:hypothetical protein